MEEIKSLKIILRGTGFFIIGIISSKLFSYFYNILIARWFGAEKYGIFTLAIAFFSIFRIINLLGLTSGITRYAAYYKARKDKEKIKRVLHFSIILVLIFSFFLSFLLFLFSEYFSLKIFKNSELVHVFKLLAPFLSFVCLIFIFNSFFIGLKRIEYVTFYDQILSNLLKLVLLVILYFYGLKLKGVVLSWTIPPVIVTFIYLWIINKKNYLKPINFKFKNIEKELIRFSVPIIFTSFLGIVMGKIDRIILGYYLDEKWVGIYSAMFSIALFLTIASQGLRTLFLPVITELYAIKKSEEIERIYKTVCRWLFYINFPIFLLLISLSKQIIKYSFGIEFIPGYKSLIILSIGYFIFPFTKFGNSMLLMIKKTKYIMINSYIVALLNIILNIMLIPIFGIIGASLATTISLILNFSLVIFEVSGFFGYTPFSGKVISSIMAGLISISFTNIIARAFFVNFNFYLVFVFLVLYLMLYLFLILVFRGLEKEDIEIMKIIEKRTGIKNEHLRELIKKFI